MKDKFTQKAIQEAIGGGWTGENGDANKTVKEVGSVIFLDLFFWSSLAKARQWGGRCENCVYVPAGIHIDIGARCPSCGRKEMIPDALYYWHRFIDHLFYGNDAESFFRKLLN